MATIQGTTWHDRNQNGRRESDEPGLSDWTLFIDQNRNGQLDTGEQTTQSNADGNYAFTNLIPDVYTVAQVEPADWRSLLTPTSQIPFTGLAANGQGAIAWNTDASAPEPARIGHFINVPATSGTVEVAFYYLASRDYDGIDPTSPGGIQAEDGIVGFANLTAALAQHGYAPDDLKVQFGLASLGEDQLGQDWFIQGDDEVRFYQGGRLVIQLDGEDLVGGPLPNFVLRTDYAAVNNEGLPTSSGGIQNFRPQDIAANSSAEVQQVAQALLTDLGGDGLNFQYLSLSPTLGGEGQFFASGRAGALFEANVGAIHKTGENLVTGDAYSVLISDFDETVTDINFFNVSETADGNPDGGGEGGSPPDGGNDNPAPVSLSLALADDYLATHPDLLVAFGYNLEAAVLHYEQWGRAEGRTIDGFAEDQYLASYDDLILAFGNDVTAATRHYIQTGFSEGRTLTFQPLEYLASYSDLLTALGNDRTAATQHYLQNGFSEGRDRDRFDEGRYLASHDDLLTLLGSDRAAATQHYVLVGAAEGRRLTFEPDDYLASYGDLIEALGYDLVAATEHFITLGVGEGRDRDRFDEVAYLNRYADLQAAFGTDLAAATQHYIEHGYAEGRVA